MDKKDFIITFPKLQNKKAEWIIEPLKNFNGINVIVHGSYADNTNIAFSDFDDLIIINEKNVDRNDLKVFKALRESEKRMFISDPLQHHGHFITTRESLSNYDGKPVPIHLLNESKSVWQELKIIISCNEKKLTQKFTGDLNQTIIGVLSILNMCKNGSISIYNFKCLISAISLLPCLIEQIKGSSIGKKEAIDNYVCDKDVNIRLSLEWASHIRKSWKEFMPSNVRLSFSRLLSTFFHSTTERFHLRTKILGKTNTQEKLNIPYENITGWLNNIRDSHQFGYKKLTLNQYEEFYSNLVDHISNKYEIINYGRFGEIKSPGISDLDVLFICRNSSDVEKVKKDCSSYIQEDNVGKYIMEPHEPLVIDYGGLEYLHKLHSLYGLNLAKRDSNLGPKNNEKTIELVWSIFLIEVILECISQPYKQSGRSKLLLAKNAVQSVENLGQSDSNLNMKCIYRIRDDYINGKMTEDRIDNFLTDSLIKIIDGLRVWANENIDNKIIKSVYTSKQTKWKLTRSNFIKYTVTSKNTKLIEVPKEILWIKNSLKNASRDKFNNVFKNYVEDVKNCYRYCNSNNTSIPFLVPSSVVISTNKGYKIYAAEIIRLYKYNIKSLLASNLVNFSIQ
ncbi:MAG: hypothetical protein ACON5H_05705 [Akkermansiaceae bacterium]